MVKAKSGHGQGNVKERSSMPGQHKVKPRSRQGQGKVRAMSKPVQDKVGASSWQGQGEDKARSRQGREASSTTVIASMSIR